jgi:hypothetical protein
VLRCFRHRSVLAVRWKHSRFPYSMLTLRILDCPDQSSDLQLTSRIDGSLISATYYCSYTFITPSNYCFLLCVCSHLLFLMKLKKATLRLQREERMRTANGRWALYRDEQRSLLIPWWEKCVLQDMFAAYRTAHPDLAEEFSRRSESCFVVLSSALPSLQI